MDLKRGGEGQAHGSRPARQPGEDRAEQDGHRAAGIGKPEKKERPACRVAHRLPDALGTGAVTGQNGHGKRERAAERADHPNPCRIMSARHRASAPALPPQTTRTTAIAWQSACESDKDELSQPWCCARSASAPLSRSSGSGPSRVTSISRRGNGMSGSANALITASLAANLAASLCTRLLSRQSLISLAVKILRRYWSPNAASESWTSSMATTSHPTRTRCPSTSPGREITQAL